MALNAGELWRLRSALTGKRIRVKGVALRAQLGAQRPLQIDSSLTTVIMANLGFLLLEIAHRQKFTMALAPWPGIRDSGSYKYVQSLAEASTNFYDMVIPIRNCAN